MIEALGSEFNILMNSSLSEIEAASSKQIAHAIDRVRKGDINIVPGYDGEFGIVKVFQDGEDRGMLKQEGLFN